VPTTETWARELVTYARDKLARHLAQIARCLQLLTPDQVWHRTNDHTNSVGNLVLHLTGNVRQWLVGGLAGQPITRDRPAEFAQRTPLPPRQLLLNLDLVAQQALQILADVDDAALVRRYTIQDYDVTGVAAILHVVEHFSWHTGQIVHITKMLKNVDLSLYDAQGHRTPGGPP
jgi:uncharacterized damage-inducible protein DinB